MTELATEAFPSEQLESISPGFVTVGVPVSEGIIQIETDEIDEMTDLIVSKDRFGHIIVALANGGRMQVEHVESELVDGDIVSKRHQIFAEPVHDLKFSKTNSLIQGKTGWQATGEGLVVTDMIRLRSLANIIGDYASLKQRQNQQDSMVRRGIRAIVTRKPL